MDWRIACVKAGLGGVRPGRRMAPISSRARQWAKELIAGGWRSDGRLLGPHQAVSRALDGGREPWLAAGRQARGAGGRKGVTVADSLATTGRP